MNDIQTERYNRHIIIPEVGTEGQKKLMRSSVLVVGAGGLGSPVLQYLTAAGTGRIVIADHDMVSLSNLQRQVLYTTDDIGKPKVECAAARLKKLNPEVSFETHSSGLTEKNAVELIRSCDVVIGATDNFESRRLMDKACGELKIPFVHASVGTIEGQISVFHHQDGPAYADLYPDEPEQTGSQGIFSPLPGITGSMQAMECIKIILGIPGILSGKLMIYNAQDCSCRILSFVQE